MITPAGTIAAHATVAAPSVHTCGQGTGAVLQPPVSASDNKVYYRDGNTKIKFLTPDGQTGDVTTVPGSATKVSFFSVSPDDSRIAVLVEDLTPTSTIKLSLYVEDLIGHTNHKVIFTNTVPKLKGTLHVRARGPGAHRMARRQRGHGGSRGQDRQPMRPEQLALPGGLELHRQQQAGRQQVRLGGESHRQRDGPPFRIPVWPVAVREEHVPVAGAGHRRAIADNADCRPRNRRELDSRGA